MKKTVIYAGTRNVYRIMRTAVSSLLANTPVDRVVLLIEDDEFPYDLPVEVINVSSQTFFPEKGPNYANRWSYMSMLRCAFDQMFPDEKVVLWLDVDTIVDDDVSELFETNMDGYYFAGVKETVKSQKTPYINAGVLLMNLEHMREKKHGERLVKYLNTTPLELPDQDAINHLSQGKIKFIDSKYNACPFTAECKSPKIIHFAGRIVYDNDSIYQKYAEPGERNIRTLIAVPCFDMVHTDFMRCMVEMEKPEGTSFAVIKNTMIYTARNNIVDNAIRMGFDRVLWLDSDLVFSSDLLNKLSADMDITGADFVTGIYFQRVLPTKPVIYKSVRWEVKPDGWVETGADNYLDYPDKMFEIAGSGFGCVMTSVPLLKRMKDKYGAPFTPLMGISEDLAFCWRMGRDGEKMYCDPNIKCGHIGQIEINESAYRGTK